MSRYRLAWLLLFALGAGFEGWTLVNDTPSDTLSAQVWALVDVVPLAKVAIGGFLIWLGVHWLGPKKTR